ncbi:hypothetical protein [Gracilimonas sp.]|uniref:hypothetical protein n=1 Tax=Gracilimonas sp. TaxID=1974203 RepID=UPI002872079C|nr:hypothetical protein [Gracilimonas sp.]
MRDQTDAEVHLLITNQQTGSGGREYDLNFLGQKNISGKSYNLKFISPKSDTEDTRRRKLVRHVKLGLIYFLVDRDVLSDLDVNFMGEVNDNESGQDSDSDPWNSWVFELRASTSFSGEQSRGNLSFDGSFDARRITDEWKTTFDYRRDYNRRVFRSKNDDGSTKTDIFITESQNFTSLIAKSLGDHWTVGGYSRVRSSSQDNVDLSIGASPSIEYSLFPYNEFNRRQITFRLGMAGAFYDYSEVTILNVTEEFLWRPELNIVTDFTQPWGGVFSWINAGTYLHDPSKNRVNMRFRVNVRLLRGLSIFLSGRYSLINDQISLPAGDLTEEERLLNLKQQATSYNYGGSIGFEFNFGSIYNSVVNPRL